MRGCRRRAGWAGRFEDGSYRGIVFPAAVATGPGGTTVCRHRVHSRERLSIGAQPGEHRGGFGDTKQQGQRIDGRFNEAVLLIKTSGLYRDRVDENCADAGDLRGLDDAHHCVAEESAPTASV